MLATEDGEYESASEGEVELSHEKERYENASDDSDGIDVLSYETGERKSIVSVNCPMRPHSGYALT